MSRWILRLLRWNNNMRNTIHYTNQHDGRLVRLWGVSMASLSQKHNEYVFRKWSSSGWVPRSDGSSQGLQECVSRLFHSVSPFYRLYKNYSRANPTVLTVIMGVWNPSSLDNTQSSTVASITVHPSFVASTLVNDIAILTLSQPIVLGIYRNINTICLASTGASTSYVGQT